MYPRRHGNRRVPGLAFALLAGQMAQVGFGNIPPVTLAGIAAQVIAFLRPHGIRWPSVGEVCISPLHVWYRQDFHRLFLSAFFHSDEWHLYFNMASFLWKGINLEPKVGSRYFVYMIGVFTVLTNALYVGLGMLAEEWLEDPSYLSQCAVGFSGVLFALKVITTHMSPGTHRILGFIPVPSRYACWAELLLIHIMVPRASFIGHLSGILVGLLYVKGPLKLLMDKVISPVPSTAQGIRSGNRGFFSQSRYRNWASSDHGSTYDSNTDTRWQQQTGPADYTGTRWQQQTASADYTGGMTEDEQMEYAMRESLRQPGSGTSSEADSPLNPTAPPEPSAPPVGDDEGYSSNSAPYPTENIPNVPRYPTENPPYPNEDPPPYPGYSTAYTNNQHSSERLYPDLSHVNSRGGGVTGGTASSPSATADEIRRRRLQRFDQT